MSAVTLVALVAAFDLLAPDLPPILLTVALVAAVFTGALLILENSLAAAVAALTLALLAPWTTFPNVYHMAAFSLASAFAWLLCLYLKRLPAGRHSLPLVALASAVSFAVSPQALALLVIVAAWYRLRPDGFRRPWLASAIIASVALVLSVQWALGAPVRQLVQWRQFVFIPAGHWTVKAWSDAAHGAGYNKSVLDVGQSVYWPLIIPLAALAWSLRKRWWLPATLVGAVLMLGGTLLFEGAIYFQYSLPLEMGLLVPLAIMGVAALPAESPVLSHLAGRNGPFGWSFAG